MRAHNMIFNVLCTAPHDVVHNTLYNMLNNVVLYNILNNVVLYNMLNNVVLYNMLNNVVLYNILYDIVVHKSSCVLHDMHIIVHHRTLNCTYCSYRFTI